MSDSIRREIKKCIDSGEKDFIITPFGYLGKKVKKILNEEFNIKEVFCVDNNCYDGKNVFAIDQMPYINDKYIVLVAIKNEYYRYQLVEAFSDYIPKERIRKCVCFDDSQKKIFDDSSKIKLDFLCIGFQKCGTTSLQTALSQHPGIYLPREKETFFIKEINEETHQKFKESYPEELIKDKLVGGIEPTYFMNAESVYRYFGTDLKLVLCLANPMKALYSRFKMAMRDMGNQEMEYIRKYGRVTPKLFDEWVEGKLHLYKYIDYIKFYLHYYKQEQMKILISELLYHSPGKEMDELQLFLGLRDSAKMVYDQFPHINKGSKVSKSYAAACVNKKMWELIAETKDLETQMQIRELRHEIFEITTEPYTEKMLEETYVKLHEYYGESIRGLENFLGQSLEGVWY